MSEAYIPAYEAYYKADSCDPSQAERLAIWKEACGAIIAALSGDDVPAPVPCPMDTAPRDGTMVRLLVQFDDHATEDTAGPAWTIGANNDDNVGDDEREGWRFAGWCWDHDHFTEGKGTPVGWLPMLDSPKGGTHPDDAAVDAFSSAMKAKLAEARAKGRGGWNGDEPGMQQRLSDMLRAHVEKGDPRDVANFCMFLHQRGEAISPNAGSEAWKAELRAAQDDGHDCAIRYVLGYLNGAGDCGSTYYEEILNSCGRDRIIKSAITDGELEFTGLAEYIKRDGTRAEKRRVRAALRAQAQASDAEVRL